jgi:hypothetical protein
MAVDKYNPFTIGSFLLLSAADVFITRLLLLPIPPMQQR